VVDEEEPVVKRKSPVNEKPALKKQKIEEDQSSSVKPTVSKVQTKSTFKAPGKVEKEDEKNENGSPKKMGFNPPRRLGLSKKKTIQPLHNK